MEDWKVWDGKVAAASGWCHFLQSAEWAQAQQHTAWKVDLAEIDSYPVAVYKRSVPGLGKILHMPKLATMKVGQVTEFTKGVRQYGGGAILAKLDIDQVYDEEVHQSLLKQGWIRTPSPNYEETVLVDLTKTTEELLASFRMQVRWEINTGIKRGVEVKQVEMTEANMKIAYDLLSETYGRANFFTRSKAYTETYWQAFRDTGQGMMYQAWFQGAPVAASFVIKLGDRAYYKDGASTRVKPDPKAGRAMHWQIIQDLKEQGVKIYDLCGVSTKPDSELAGVTVFKTGFADPVTLQYGYELPLNPGKYKLWKQVGERLALKHASSVKKELWY